MYLFRRPRTTSNINVHFPIPFAVGSLSIVTPKASIFFSFVNAFYNVSITSKPFPLLHRIVHMLVSVHWTPLFNDHWTPFFNVQRIPLFSVHWTPFFDVQWTPLFSVHWPPLFNVRWTPLFNVHRKHLFNIHWTPLSSSCNRRRTCVGGALHLNAAASALK